ncbi:MULTISPECIES: hypothetical protein [Olivibacter]|jgi:hypothetical protein|uniref:Uncharacterized protein n=2 Tax=Olivibacter TaxID=376469 RepID=A0ABV6HL64_9SPHI|nr:MULTISPECIES: hypothetical protein [Olivibacter]MCL4639069.1 hypothetical protein [Olivibacter sp. UJ_SKK_5.1]MDM8175665.1 hypothetical protein [Olivibacter sp. 47]MDX3914272.1 hypothetical protein [Pseudosphingobacterium sp.]QEL02403.1 hypothetical protein FKG96_16820 [Olivibacter sp. LS-1]
MHTDKEIKDWVCSHIHQLIQENEASSETEFKTSVDIEGEDGRVHTYTVFLERSNINDREEWIVRNIVRPEQLQ